ncbi:MAG: GNAT family protein [Bacteroidota bacterium]
MPNIRIVINSELVLAVPQKSMAQDLWAIAKEEEKVPRYWLAWTEKHNTLASIAKFLHHAKLYNEGGQRLTLMMIHQEKAIGSVSLVRIDRLNRIAEIGYWIGKQWQGKGWVRQSVSALIAHCFQHMAINRLEIRVPLGHQKSAAIPLGLDFHQEGLLRQGLWHKAQYHDLQLYALLRQDWLDKTVQTKI